MDPRDRPLVLPDGATCTVCGASVPTGRIRILARRDDLAFLELACADCGSAAVGLLTFPAGRDGAAFLDVDADRSPDATDRVGVDRRRVRPIDAADVRALNEHLAAWRGDLVGWLDALRGDAPAGPDVER
ncbi:MAG: hypothetical protein ABI553_03790 [Chloroflexota bacterium]